jgi:DNA replication protein DnaC
MVGGSSASEAPLLKASGCPPNRVNPKTHIAAALSRALIENGYRALFTRTTDIVQSLQAAHQELALEAAITRLDRYDLLVLDDLSYARRDRAEISVLFELIGKRYGRRSILITANQPFGEWNNVFPIPP